MAEQWLPLLLHTELRQGRRDAAQAVIRMLRDSIGFNANDTLRGVARWGEALLAHAAQQPAHARASLAEAVAFIPTGRWSALARLDLAWLYAEAGDVRAARSLVRDIAPWLDAQPAGLFTAARLRAAEGDASRAVGLLKTLLRWVPEHRTDRVLLLLGHCEGARSATALPAALSLPSCL